MKSKKEKQFYIDRAKADLRDLIVFFNVTRPQHDKAFFKNGKFELKEMLKQMAFVEEWDKRTKEEKKRLAQYCAQYSKNLNYALGIPSELITKVCGEWTDDDGRHHSIKSSEIVQMLVDEGFIKVVNQGRKFSKDDEGNYSVKAWWCKKYIMANRKQWYKLMSDDRYTELYKYASPRLRKILGKWFESFKQKESVTAEDVLKMYKVRLMDFQTLVVLWYRIFGISKERIVSWTNKYKDMIEKVNSEKLIENDEVSKEFWERLYYGNIRNGKCYAPTAHYDKEIEKWVYGKIK